MDPYDGKDSNEISRVSLKLLNYIIAQHNADCDSKEKLVLFEHLTGRLVDVSIFLEGALDKAIPLQVKSTRSMAKSAAFVMHLKTFTGLAMLFLWFDESLMTSFDQVDKKVRLWFIPAQFQFQVRLHTTRLCINNQALKRFEIGSFEDLSKEFIKSLTDTSSYNKQPTGHIAFYDALLRNETKLSTHYLQHKKLHEFLKHNDNKLVLLPVDPALPFTHIMGVRNEKKEIFYYRAKLKSSLSGVYYLSHAIQTHRQAQPKDFDVVVCYHPTESESCAIIPIDWLERNTFFQRTILTTTKPLYFTKIPDLFKFQLTDINLELKVFEVLSETKSQNINYIESVKCFGADIRLTDEYQKPAIQYALMGQADVSKLFKDNINNSFNSNQPLQNRPIEGKQICPGCKNEFASRRSAKRHIDGRPHRNQPPCKFCADLNPKLKVPIPISA
jgi:hypothetical protein